MKRLALVILAAVAAFVVYAQSDTSAVDETITTLQEGVTNIPLDAALTNIEGWRQTLENSDDAAQQIVGSQLGDLASALQTEPVDEREVGSLLVSLGKSTVIVGEDVGNNQLVALGDLLTQAGSSLSVEATDGAEGGDQ